MTSRRPPASSRRRRPRRAAPPGLLAQFRAAARISHDAELEPANGQLVLLPPDPAVDFITAGGCCGVNRMFARSGEILLADAFRRGDWTRHAEPEVTERVIADHRALFAGFG